MSRLLYAAARGARIQCEDYGVWSTVFAVFFGKTKYTYRIHPEDAHLAYGPVSTALREMAEDVVWNGDWASFLAGSIANEFTEHSYRAQCEPDDQLFYLFLAEFLADEGM
jgi:hypothetical protein